MEPVAILGAVAAGAFQKHIVPRMPNGAIPFVNGALASGAYALMGNDWRGSIGAGVLTALTATGTHQVIKLAVRSIWGALLGGKGPSV